MNLTSIPIPEAFSSNLPDVLKRWAKEYDLRWLLAHADDGVIWGEFREGGLALSSDAFPEISPPLRMVTLQQIRIFGTQTEIYVWKENDAWKGRVIRDNNPEDTDAFDEEYLLWGTEVKAENNGFVLLQEGQRGLRHSPPLPGEIQLPILLRIRHYVAYDEDGQAHICYSRLVSLGNNGR